MDEAELECRVCREGPTDDRKLYAPCMCSGSILWCHQDCLEQWLNHSGKDYCELCKTKYVFRPVYAENTPKSIPLKLLLLSFVNTCYLRIIPLLARIVAIIVCWLITVPAITSIVYRNMLYIDRVARGNVSLSSLDLTSLNVWDNTISGLVITGLIGLSFILLVCI